MQEEILINRSRTGTTIYFFNTDINEYNYSVSTDPAVLKFGTTESVPIELGVFDGVFLSANPTTVLWKRNTQQNNIFSPEIRMDFILDTPYSPPSADDLLTRSSYTTFSTNNHVSFALDHITGRTFSQVNNTKLSQSQKDSITNRFLQSMNSLFTAGTTSYVFFEDMPIDDFYANIKLERSFDVLNTLNIYNKVSGEYSLRESATGVVFGKLEAVQKLTDSDGNKIRIPLRNVPIGIFNSSNDFETPNSLDADGNRLRLNFRPLDSSEDNYPRDHLNEYFNIETSTFDNKFLNGIPLDGLNIHPTFKNVVYTNENGEFFLHDISVGAQILFFEVDLLKQGLTKDEVALNYFPYPPSFENFSIDTIPHYFYRALPIEVVPSWGEFGQTGYTQINVSVNLDLRKWSTYIIPPVTYKGFPIDSAGYQDYSRAPLIVQVRDMSKFNQKVASAQTPEERLETYPSRQIQMVEILDIIDRSVEQQWDFANEFSQIKDKAIFHTYGYHAIKLPSNIYDDAGYKTDKFGDPMSSNTSTKGVWLCGYQLKMFLTKESELYRTTSLALSHDANGTWYDRDHFHCCLNEEIQNYYSSSYDAYEKRGSGIGIFPYEKAWDKNYPERYSIPKCPKEKTYVDYYLNNYRDRIECPEFQDGDLIKGNSMINPGINGQNWNGFGLSWNGWIEQYTDFSTDVIGSAPTSGMYKYEPIGMGKYGQNQYFGCYASGYYNDIDYIIGKHSEVKNAENYQRLEAGYGYFLFPSSMPRIVPVITESSIRVDGFLPTEVDSTHRKHVQNYCQTTIDEYVDNSTTDLGMSKNSLNLKGTANHMISFSVLNNGKTIAMDLSKKLGTFPLINDKLNIYRIIDSKYTVSHDTLQPTIPTFTSFVFEEFRVTKEKIYKSVLIPFVKYDYNRVIPEEEPLLTDSGSINLDVATIEIYNTGDIPLVLLIQSEGQGTDLEITIEVGFKIILYTGDVNFIETTTDTQKMIDVVMKKIKILASGNKDYDEVDNRYTNTSITFKFSASWPGEYNCSKVISIPIKDKANVNCVFPASNTKYDIESQYYANTIWRAVDVKTYKNWDSNGWLENTNNNKKNYDGYRLYSSGVFANPGKYNAMGADSNGTSFAYIDDSCSANTNDYRTERMNAGGTMELYWSKGERKNPNASFTPNLQLLSDAKWDVNELWKLTDPQY